MQRVFLPVESQTQVDCNSGRQMTATLVFLGCSPDIAHSPAGAPLVLGISFASQCYSHGSISPSPSIRIISHPPELWRVRDGLADRLEKLLI